MKNNSAFFPPCLYSMIALNPDCIVNIMKVAISWIKLQWGDRHYDSDAPAQTHRLA